MGDNYAVDNASAGQAATDTETAIADLDGVKTTITDNLSNAEGALPPEFTVVATLASLRTSHASDVGTIKDYATSCVGAVRACLTVYENSSAEMVAEQKATEAKVVFEHGTAFTNTESALNDWANGRDTTPGGEDHKGLAAINKDLPSSSEGTSVKVSHESHTANDGSSSASYTSGSYETGGYSGKHNTYVATNTHNGVTDTTTYYTGHTGRGSEQTPYSHQTYAVAPANGGPQ